MIGDLITLFEKLIAPLVSQKIPLKRFYYNGYNFESCKKKILILDPRYADTKDIESIGYKQNKAYEDNDYFFCDYTLYLLNNGSYFVSCSSYVEESDEIHDFEPFLSRYIEDIVSDKEALDLVFCENAPRLIELGVMRVDSISDLVREKHLEFLLKNGFIKPNELEYAEIDMHINYLLTNNMLDRSILIDDLIEKHCIILMQAKFFSEEEINELGLRLLVHKKQLEILDASKYPQ